METNFDRYPEIEKEELDGYKVRHVGRLAVAQYGEVYFDDSYLRQYGEIADILI
jgi:hypothetical protein